MSREFRDRQSDEALEFTVASVWRSERVTCPHADVLRAWLDGGLETEAGEFVTFHVRESECPYCNAVVSDLEAGDDEAAASRSGDRGLEDRLLRSTIAALRARSGGSGA